jgi:hypothetical protein
MAFDHQEEEQLASVKAWWAKYGNAATWVLVAGLAAYSGWTGWQYYQRTQAVEASALYDELQTSVGKDNAKVQRAAADLASRYGPAPPPRSPTAHPPPRARPEAPADRGEKRVRRERPEDRQGQAGVGDRARQRRIQGDREDPPGRRAAR